MKSATPGVGANRHRGLLVVLGGTMLLDAVEVSTMIVAVPTTGPALSLPLTGSQWLITGFALGFGVTLLPGARAVERFGRRRVYLAALVGFAAASLVGGVAAAPTLLVATRVVKGMCAALTAPTGLAIILAAFPDGPARRRAMSVYTTLGASGFAAGLLLAGALGQIDWRLIFLFPAPVGLALFAAGCLLIPHDTPARRRGRGTRLIRPGLLRYGPLRRSMLGAAALNGSHIGMMLIVSVQLHQALGWSPAAAAAGMLAASAPFAAAAPLSGRLVARFGTTRLIAIGAFGPPLGYALYLRLPWPTSYALDILPTLLGIAWGFVFAFAALNVQATADVPDEDQRDAVTYYQSAVQFAAAVVTPAVAALLTASAPPAGAGGAAITVSYRPAIGLVLAVGLVGLVAAAAAAGRRGRQPSPAPAAVSDARQSAGVFDAPGAPTPNCNDAPPHDMTELQPSANDPTPGA